MGTKVYTLEDTPQIPRIVQALAQHSLRMQISIDILVNWETITKAGGVADDAVDTLADPHTRKIIMQACADYISGDVDIMSSNDKDFLAKMTSLRSIVQVLPLTQRDLFASHLRRLFIATERLRNETDIRKASRLIMVEGQIYAHLFRDVLPDELRENPHYEKFSLALTKLFRAGNCIDALFDLPDDYRNGITFIKPTIANRLVLLGNALVQVSRVLRQISLSFLIRVAAFEVREFHRRKT